MSVRELVILGTASQAPTRYRNHNGYFLRWDGAGILFDPGEGTQRQMVHAGVAAPGITHIAITHFHGDHCLGLPGVIQRLALDRVGHPVTVLHPAAGAIFLDRLRHAAVFHDTTDLRAAPISGDGVVVVADGFRIEARRLDHGIETYGYRLVEDDGRRMLPHQLAAAGVVGPDIGRLQQEGRLQVGGRTVTLEEMSEPRPGQRVAFVMDTRWCEAAIALAQEADLLVCEATFAAADAQLATGYGHLTAEQAGRLAAAAGVRRLVITHFSQRYPDADRLAEEAAGAFGGEVVAAADLMRVAVPARR